MAELETKGGMPSTPQPQQMNPLQVRMGIRGIRSGQGTNDLLPNIAGAMGNMGYEAGGLTTDLASRLGASPETAAKFGYGANVATDIVPMVAGGIAGAASKVPEAAQGISKWLMARALKAPLSEIESGNAARAVDTMLKEGWNVTKGSVETQATKINDLGKEISAALANAPETVKGSDIGKRLLDTYERFKTQANPQEDLAAIKKAWESFRNHPDLVGRFQNIPVELANRIKQGTYKALESKSYGELQGATTEAQKALARGMRETVSEVRPDVAAKITQQGEMLNAKSLAERQANLLSKQDPISLGWIATNPLAALGYAAERSAPLKAWLANRLYGNATAIPASAGRVAGGAVGAGMSQPEK